MDIKTLLSDNIHNIVQYSTIVIGYFLTFLFKKSTTRTGNNLQLVFRENTDTLKKRMKEQERKFKESLTQANVALEESRANYVAATKLIENLETRLSAAEAALQELTRGESNE